MQRKDTSPNGVRPRRPSLVAAHVRRLEAYVPGEQPKSRDVVKLNTNENPYPPSPACAKVLKAFDLDRLRRYPDPVFAELRAALARLNKTTPERVFVGNGSDEILSLAARAFVEDDGAIASLDPSYSLYKTLAAIRNVRWEGVGEIGELANPRIRECRGVEETIESSSPSRCGGIGDAALPLYNGQGASQTCRGRGASPMRPQKRGNVSPIRQFANSLISPSLFLLTNPNAPTGEFREPATIAAFARKFTGVVLVDEAYADFARTNCMPLATAPKNRNVLVMRTFSKSYSLAGLRVGYCVGPKPLIDALYKVKDSYNVDAIAQAVALAAVKDQKWMKANVAKVKATRTWVTDALRERGWDVIPSEANFVFARPPKPQKAAALFAALKRKGVFVRYFPGPKTGDRLRITIGTDAETKRLMRELENE